MGDADECVETVARQHVGSEQVIPEKLRDLEGRLLVVELEVPYSSVISSSRKPHIGAGSRRARRREFPRPRFIHRELDESRKTFANRRGQEDAGVLKSEAGCATRGHG